MVIRTELWWQVQRLLSSNSEDLKGTMESLVKIVQSQGWKQLFSGLSINYLKVRIHCYEVAEEFFLFSVCDMDIFVLVGVLSGCAISGYWFYCLWCDEIVLKGPVTRWSYCRGGDQQKEHQPTVIPALMTTPFFETQQQPQWPSYWRLLVLCLLYYAEGCCQYFRPFNKVDPFS